MENEILKTDERENWEDKKGESGFRKTKQGMKIKITVEIRYVNKM